MKSLILAAGYGTRLYPLTKEYPKPLLKVGNKPLIDYIVERLASIKEVDEVIVVTNSKFFPRFKAWKKTLKTKKRVNLLDDLTKSNTDKRGAIGDMYFALRKKKIKDDLLVIGGDNVFDGDLRDLINFSRAKDSASVIGIYKLKNKSAAKRYGVIKLDKNNKIIDFKEKPSNPQSALVAMCLYYFPAGKLYLIKEYLDQAKNKPDATGFYIDWLRKKESTYGYVFKGRWYDIGDAEFYNKAKKSFH